MPTLEHMSQVSWHNGRDWPPVEYKIEAEENHHWRGETFA